MIEQLNFSFTVLLNIDFHVFERLDFHKNQKVNSAVDVHDNSLTSASVVHIKVNLHLDSV